MRNRTLVAAVAAVVLFSGVTAGASSLVLDGSDSAPGTGTGQAACAGPLIVTNPVDMGGYDNNRVVHVNIDGDMTVCVGGAVLAVVLGVRRRYAFPALALGVVAAGLLVLLLTGGTVHGLNYLR